MTARKPRQATQSRGLWLVETITEEMSRAGVVPAGAELELMKTVRQLLEHRDRLQKIVATEGEVIVTRKGVVKAHPALPAHLQVSATIPKVLSGIVIGDSTATANHRQRKAGPGALGPRRATPRGSGPRLRGPRWWA